jgi:hypothetical protein
MVCHCAVALFAQLVPDFFAKLGVAVMSSREFFEFVTDAKINNDNITLYLEAIQAKVLRRQTTVMSASEQAEQQVRIRR